MPTVGAPTKQYEHTEVKCWNRLHSYIVPFSTFRLAWLLRCKSSFCLYNHNCGQFTST